MKVEITHSYNSFEVDFISWVTEEFTYIMTVLTITIDTNLDCDWPKFLKDAFLPNTNQKASVKLWNYGKVSLVQHSI